MIPSASSSDPVRRQIEALSSQLSLPTVRRALGILEGEHPSGKRGNGYDYEGVRLYQPEDEARLIDWHASARMGLPMVTEHDRLVTSRVWLLLDIGAQMQATTVSGESAASVAANALRMFAALSVRRSDEVSLVAANEQTITRLPCQGGFAAFDQTLNQALSRAGRAGRNIDALLTYAKRIPDHHSLIVVATDETAIRQHHVDQLRELAQTHPITVVSVATINPLDPHNGFTAIADGNSGRQIPAFLRQEQAAQEVTTHRHYRHQALKQDLARSGSTLVHASSSQAMLQQFMRLLSTAMITSGAAPSPAGVGR